ncbi:MAG TPA: hypothetical protein VK195_19625 [Burkholderiaceae bacterium]|nr:hypothetical protein [Burkholderiaceae bacterium]
MGPAGDGAEAPNIGSVAIDPSAEQTQAGVPAVSGKQEEQFFKETGDKFKLAHNQQNLGYLGKLFGANSSAPTNIAGFVIIASFLFVGLSFFATTTPELSDARKAAIGLISSAMAFIFGAASKKE